MQNHYISLFQIGTLIFYLGVPHCYKSLKKLLEDYRDDIEHAQIREVPRLNTECGEINFSGRTKIILHQCNAAMPR